MKERRSSKELVIDAQNCIGCLACQLICSHTYHGVFNIEKSRIIIKPITHPSETPEIYFTEDCTGCATCTRYCPLGAITFQKTRDEAHLAQFG